ncbi:DUF4214 domain-containing protein [Actinoplanes sp. CA-030573]|uniref:DUF4214 domain-containing protein n=1 Tax=Actinoplanes sp. CA-030573 TaxID=3239898 RepID=UPI003D8A09E2
MADHNVAGRLSLSAFAADGFEAIAGLWADRQTGSYLLVRQEEGGYRGRWTNATGDQIITNSYCNEKSGIDAVRPNGAQFKGRIYFIQSVNGGKFSCHDEDIDLNVSGGGSNSLYTVWKDNFGNQRANSYTLIWRSSPGSVDPDDPIVGQWDRNDGVDYEVHTDGTVTNLENAGNCPVPKGNTVGFGMRRTGERTYTYSQLLCNTAGKVVGPKTSTITMNPSFSEADESTPGVIDPQDHLTLIENNCWQSAGQFVQGLYQGLLGRAGTQADYDAWAGRLTGVPAGPQRLGAAQALVRDMFTTAEFTARSTGLTDGQFTAALFRGLMHDDVQDGSWYWVQQLHAGNQRVDVLNAFLASDEFTGKAGRLCRGKTGPAYTPEQDPPCWQSAEQIVATGYLAALGRKADPGGAAGFVDQINTAGYGTARSDAIRSFYRSLFTSAEYAARGRTDGQFTQDVFQAALHRSIDDGSGYWVNGSGRPAGIRR